MIHRSLNLVSFNVRSLVDTSRRLELSNLLRHNKIDIAFIQECHIQKNSNIKLNGYNFIYDYSRIGTAIAIKDSITYNRIAIDNVEFNSVFIQIDLIIDNIPRKILFGSVYIPCNHNGNKIYDSLSKIVNFCGNFDGFVVGGDLNSKNPAWGDLVENGNGKTLYKWLQDHPIDVVRLCDSSPSFPNGSSYLDHFLVSPKLLDFASPNYKISSLPSFSDHYPIKMELKFSAFDFSIRPPRLFTSYKNTNWRNFRTDLEIATISIMPSTCRNLCNDEINILIEEFTSICKNVSNSHSEKIEIKNHKIIVSDKIKKFFGIKHRWQKDLKKIYHRAGNRLGQDYIILSKQILLLKTIIKELVNMEQAERFSQRLVKINPGPSAFKEIYRITGNRKTPFCNNLTVNENIITDDSEKCEIFRDFYSRVYSEKIPERPVVDLDTRITSYISNVPRSIYTFTDSFNSMENEDSLHFIKLNVVKQIVKNIKNKHSSGPDGISNFLIKKFPDTSLEFLTIIFNNCLNNGYFPLSWKVGKILPLKKNATSSSLDEFRPISLLSNIGKLFEHIIKIKLEDELIIDPISCFQFGFRQAHSTQHALLKFHADVTRNLRNQKCTVAVSLDIQKAFDTACHKGILHKLVGLGVDPYLAKLFFSYFSERKFNIQINDASSGFGNVNSGVPQGSVLAPFLFNLYLHDFPHEMAESKALLYADDCLIFSHDESPITALNKTAEHLSTIYDYYKTWGIDINASKSEAICIRNASGKCSRFVVPESKRLHLSLDETEIPFNSKLKYLGVVFDKLMKFNNHGRSQLAKSKKITGMFSRLLNNNYLSQKTKLLIYKVAIRSVLSYAFPIWFTISPTVAKEIEIFERGILRRCINKNFQTYTKRYSNEYIYNKSAVTPFCQYILSLQKKFIDKLENHDNVLMNETYDLECDFNWSDTNYLSPIGIISEHNPPVAPPNLCQLPEFYQKSSPGTHRG